jgi:hypothetical protein
VKMALLHSMTTEAVGETVRQVFSRLDACFELPPEELGRRPDYTGAWSAAEQLEHVCLANHFLLLTITKGCGKARRRAAAGVQLPEGESDLARLAVIASPGAFDWSPPSHMVPTGMRELAELRAELRNQRDHCLELLAGMPGGEGRHCSIRMSVQGLGRLDMYQWLYFLAQHARYHLAMIDKTRSS